MMTHSPVRIVTLAPDAWPAYKQLRLSALQNSPQAFSSTYANTVIRPDSFWQDRLVSAARHESWLLFAQTDDDRLVGIIGAMPAEETPGAAAILSVYLEPEFRGQGIGRQMMNAILTELRAAKFEVAQLAVNASQTAALKLYQSLGFTIVRTRNALMGDGLYYDEHDMEMAL